MKKFSFHLRFVTVFKRPYLGNLIQSDSTQISDHLHFVTGIIFSSVRNHLPDQGRNWEGAFIFICFAEIQDFIKGHYLVNLN